jgi:hypothetical protein
MPIIYEYLGIRIGFYSNDHEPIHVHAVFDGAIIKIILHVQDGIVIRVSYIEEKGVFNKSKLADLKTFISKSKNALYFAWVQFFQDQTNEDIKIKTIVITKRIK